MSAVVDVIQLAPAAAAHGYWRSVFSRLTRDKVALTFFSILVLIFVAAIFAPLIAPSDPYASSILNRLKPIGTPGHLLGTDELGRDMLTRLIYGGRLSLLMGLAPVVLAFAVGSFLGITAGFVGGRVNTAIMRTVDVFYAFPSVLLAVAISGALGAGIVNALNRSRRRCARSISSRRRARAAPEHRPSSACTSSATCSGRSSSTPPA